MRDHPVLSFPTVLPEVDPEDLCTDEERAVMAALPRGRDNAEQVPVLAEEVGLTGRRLQAVIAHLLEAHRVPIGTAMSAPYGAYIIIDPDELGETVRLLRCRGLANLQRAACLRAMSLDRYLAEVQTELRMDGAA